MEAWLHSSIHWLLTVLALPEVGLSAIFIISLVSATLLPLGSEPAVFGFVKLSPEMFWPAVLVATLGNTLGGAISYAMGLGAEKAYERWHEKHRHAATAHDDTKADPINEAAISDRHASCTDYASSGNRDLSAGSASCPDVAKGSDADPLPTDLAHEKNLASQRKIGGRWHGHISYWAHRIGPPILFFSWLPLVGDPLAAVAGWLKLSFWPSLAYMAVGKCLRYIAMTMALLGLFPGL